MTVKSGWIPPRSPYGLIQEDLFPSEYAILVACVCLNCTARRQVERVLPEFLRRWPTPEALVAGDREEIVALVSPLGFGNRRTDNLVHMSRGLISGDWSDPRDLPGCGEYAARAHEIFCQGVLGDEEPNDGSLANYWRWAVQGRRGAG